MIEKGVVLLFSGLNVKSSKMEDLANALNENNFKTLIWTLPGHEESQPLNYDVTKEEILSSVNEAFARAKELTTDNGVPLFFLGYSFGALAALYSEAKNTQIQFAARVLIAPAISVHTSILATQVLSLIFKKLPSFNYVQYRVHRYTTGSLYRVMFQMQKYLNNCSVLPESFLRAPTLVIMDERDEFLSLLRIKKWQQKKNLNNWQYLNIDNSLSQFNRFHHLIIDKQTVPKVAWHDMIKVITNTFLNSDSY